MPDPSRLPDWPAAMRDTLAAAYLDLSVTTFRMHVAPDVPSVPLTPGRVGWRRQDLDRWLASRRQDEAACPADQPANEWHTPATP